MNLVKTADKMANREGNNNKKEGNHLYETQVLKHLVSPWYNTDQVVCADSYFTLVEYALEMTQNGSGFIGVMKTVI